MSAEGQVRIKVPITSYFSKDNDGNREHGGLSATGSAAAENILPIQHEHDCLQLMRAKSFFPLRDLLFHDGFDGFASRRILPTITRHGEVREQTEARRSRGQVTARA
jgi:hypothetical protein